jgi:hypothetical protein
MSDAFRDVLRPIYPSSWSAMPPVCVSVHYQGHCDLKAQRCKQEAKVARTSPGQNACVGVERKLSTVNVDMKHDDLIVRRGMQQLSEGKRTVDNTLVTVESPSLSVRSAIPNSLLSTLESFHSNGSQAAGAARLHSRDRHSNSGGLEHSVLSA